MKKILFIILPVLLVLIYIFSAMNSFHQIHKGIYYNDKKLIKEYVKWDELRDNFKESFILLLFEESLGHSSKTIIISESRFFCISILFSGLSINFFPST